MTIHGIKKSIKNIFAKDNESEDQKCNLENSTQRSTQSSLVTV